MKRAYCGREKRKPYEQCEHCSCDGELRPVSALCSECSCGCCIVDTHNQGDSGFSSGFAGDVGPSVAN